MGMTIAEKILARTSGKHKVGPGDIVQVQIDRAFTAELSFKSRESEFQRETLTRVWDPDRVIVVMDHLVPPPSSEMAEFCVRTRGFVKRFGIKHFYEMGRHGICHPLIMEKGFARPGELIVSGDSHTCIHGAFNAAARGLGHAEMLYVLAKGETWFRVGETIKFEIVGELPDMVMSKDIILGIAGRYGTEVGVDRNFEFVGPAVEKMSLASRAAMACTCTELNAEFVTFEADQRTIDYVRARTGEPFTPVRSDPDACYAETYEVDVTDLEPQVACPHEVGNVKPVAEVEGIRIDQAFIGSCANSRFEDLQIAAGILKGKKVHPDVRFIITPATQETYKWALEAGFIETFIEAEAVVTNPTCGLCWGGHMGVLAAGERCIASSTRNFKGRMGSPEAEIYLASPATVAASAITGVITDPRKVAWE